MHLLNSTLVFSLLALFQLSMCWNKASQAAVLLACNAVLPNSHGAELSTCDGRKSLKNACVGEMEKIKWSKFYKQDHTNFKFSVLDDTFYLSYIAFAVHRISTSVSDMLLIHIWICCI